MFWASPAWWAGTPMVTTTLKVAYNAVARWITGLPLNTRSSNLITLAHLPPMDVFLDYLSLRHAIRLHFLPAHHALGPPRGQPNTHTNLPGLHRLHNLSKHLVLGKLEDRTTTTTVPGVEKATSPNPDKTTQPQELHEKWLQTLPDHTITIYTDGSRLANGAVGCGWALYHCGDRQLYRLSDGRCHLDVSAEVYDAELHAVEEAVSTLLATTMPPSKVFICIDNQAAIDTLHSNKDSHEYARRSLETIATLRLLGWQITTLWCPAHCNISGNERADKLAKLGASSPTTPCRFVRTTKTWLLSQACAEFLKQWKQTLPLSTPSFKFPRHLHGKDWADTRALWRVFCNRSPTDSPPNIEADPCPCGLDLNSSHHLLRDCPLLASQRTELVRSAIGDIQTLGFITSPDNFLPLHRFLRATGLGHTTHLCFKEAANSTMTHDDDTDSDSPEPDFGVFEH
jgi:ribonuclease HI